MWAVVKRAWKEAFNRRGRRGFAKGAEEIGSETFVGAVHF
jgi:hypothetical protein